MTYRRNAKRSVREVNDSASGGWRGRGCLAFAFPFRDQLAVVVLPGMEVLAEELQPCGKDTAQHTRFDEKVSQAGSPFAQAPEFSLALQLDAEIPKRILEKEEIIL